MKEPGTKAKERKERTRTKIQEKTKAKITQHNAMKAYNPRNNHHQMTVTT